MRTRISNTRVFGQGGRTVNIVLLVGALSLLPAFQVWADSPDPELRHLIGGITNPPAPQMAPRPAVPGQPLMANEALLDSHELIATTNFTGAAVGRPRRDLNKRQREWQEKLEIARHERMSHLYDEAIPNLAAIVTGDAPEEMKRTALLELAIAAQEQNELSKAQQIFSHYLARWPEDPSIPEVLLRQGLILRQMGLNHSALSKFYAVLTSSLVLKADKLEYYQRLVLQAQTEIAETYFQNGKFQDSVDYFNRLLKLNSPLLNKPQIHFKLMRSLASLERPEEVCTEGYDFLMRYKDAPERPEVQYYLAAALKRVGRNNDSLQQTLDLLQDQHVAGDRARWGYWQQRAGNEIANQLYREGDYLRAFDLYSALARINNTPEWQVPAWYQAGLTCERLDQAARAMEQYNRIVQRAAEVGTNASPALRTVVDMAQWRLQHLHWQTNTATLALELKGGALGINAKPDDEPY